MAALRRRDHGRLFRRGDFKRRCVKIWGSKRILFMFHLFIRVKGHQGPLKKGPTSLFFGGVHAMRGWPALFVTQRAKEKES